MTIYKNNILTSFFLIASSLIVLVFTGCDKEVSRSPVEPEVPKGFIYVDSEPDGFTIFLNDKNTGRLTPDSISYIDEGEYQITLKKNYYKDTSVVVNLGLNEKKSISIDILSNPSMYGKLNLTTSPEGAAISINDSLINEVTPVTLQNLLPGDYTVKFSMYNFRDFVLQVIVESSKTKSHNESLRDTSAWVDYQIFNSGIQSNSLTAITIDQNNIKWVGTLDKGLISFDEVKFINFNINNSQIPDNRLNCVSVDPQNRVWVGTDFGLGIYNSVSWTVYNRNNSELTSEIINTIEFDSFGNAWIGTTANLVKFDGVNWTIYNEPSGWGDWINAIYIESDNNLWLGTTLNGIYRFENSTFNSLLQPLYGYISTTISSIEKDEFDQLWFGFLPDTTAGGGISYWDGTGFNNYYIGSPQIKVNHIFIDDTNIKWIATSEGFIVYNAQNIATAFKTNNSLISSNLINSSVRDLNGNVWITTFASGLNKYKPDVE